MATLSQGIFHHLNRSYSLGREQPDWRLGTCSVDRLWTITLHYHEWAYELIRTAVEGGPEAHAAANLFRHYLDDWMTNCALDKPGARELAWNPYAIATRIGWWVRSFLLSEGHRHTVIDETDFRERLLRSLWQQAKFLRGHLEYDLRANHLLRDAVGLAWAGRFFDQPEAREWLRTAENMALEQAVEQVLPDGGHFERSPMYHIHVMEDFLTLALLLEDPEARRKMQEVWARMAECLAWMRHPDGQIPLFNDAALNSAITPEEMLRQGLHIGCDVQASPRQGGKLLRDFGLFAWHGSPWTVFFDVGPVGVRYQLGHSHADTLTVEASYRGQRLLVDPGTWAYDLDAKREYDRSTAAHNTVCVDGENSSEVWHIFRCGRTAEPQNVQVETSPSGFRAKAAHDGYRHLQGRPVLEREVVLQPNQHLVVVDRCSGGRVHRLTGGWLLDPGWVARDAEGGWQVSRPGSGTVHVRMQGPDGLKLDKSTCPYHPEFGTEYMTDRLQWSYKGPLPVEITTIFAPEEHP